MDKTKKTFKMLKELAKEQEVKNDDYKSVLECIVKHYDMAIVGNLLFIKFVYDQYDKSEHIREVFSDEKVIIEIPIRSNHHNSVKTLLDKWKKVLEENFHLTLTEVGFWKIDKTEKGMVNTHAYAVTFRRFPWIGFLEDNIGKLTNKITKKFVYNESVKKELELEVCECIKSQIIIEDYELDEFLVGLSDRIEYIAKYGMRIISGFTSDGVTKPTFIREKTNRYTVMVPYCRLDAYMDLIMNTLGFQNSINEPMVFYPHSTIISEMINCQ